MTGHLGPQPSWREDSWLDRDWEMRVHRHYAARLYWEESAML